jgi:hypothetical protein
MKIEHILLTAFAFGVLGCSSLKNPYVFVNETVKSHQVTSSGGVLVDNPVSVTTAGVGKGKSNVDVCSSYDTKTGEVVEIDVEINNGYFFHSPWGKVRGNVYAGFLNFPNSDIHNLGLFQATASFPDLDRALPFDTNFDLRQVVGRDSHYGQLLTAAIKKGLKLDRVVSGSVEGEINYNNLFLSDQRGISHATGKVSMNFNIGGGFGLSQSVSSQYPLGNFRDSKDHKVYGEIGLNWVF